MTYNNLEKTAIVLNLMGDSFAEVILSKLPRDLVERIQQEVIPMMTDVAMPTDIDAFVLDEIVRDSISIDQALEESQVPENTNEPQANDVAWDPITSDDEMLLAHVSPELALKVLLGENRVFQRMLFDFFPDEQKKLIEDLLINRKLSMPPKVERNPFVEKMEYSMKQTFLVKLRSEAGQEMNRE